MEFRTKRLVTGVMFGAALPFSSYANAQSVAPTRDELTRNPPAPAPQSSLNVVGDVERSPCPLADPQYAEIRVKVADVQFNNLKGATPDELRSTWAEYAGTDQPVAVICEIRDAAATHLRNKGYLAAVQVPTQRIEGGVVRLEVLYARVTAIRARGQTGGAEAKLRHTPAALARETAAVLADDASGDDLLHAQAHALAATARPRPCACDVHRRDACRADGPWRAEDEEAAPMLGRDTDCSAPRPAANEGQAGAIRSPAVEAVPEVPVREEPALPSAGGGGTLVEPCVSGRGSEGQREGVNRCNDGGQPCGRTGGGDPHDLRLGGPAGSLDHSI